MISRASLSPCPAMARGWRLGRLLTTATAVAQATCGSMSTVAVLGLKSVTTSTARRPVIYSGYSVSLSSDGTRVAIGAPANDGNGNNSGHVRVYRFASASSAATPVPTLPLFGLGILVSLLVLFGLRKLRQ